MITTYTLKNSLFLLNQNNYDFLISEECNERYIDENGDLQDRTRKFHIFPTYKDYLKSLEYYKNCHEILIPHKDIYKGRLIFDFDIKKEIPKTFKKDIENLIIKTFKEYYNDVNVDILEFVWLNCENKKKISKHLIVKNTFFCENWIRQIKYFYDNFKIEVKKDKNFNWIDCNDLVDYQIARKNASMRMPFNSKLKGNPLFFDNKRFKFQDGLIYPHDSFDRSREQRIYMTQHKFFDLKEYEKIYSDIELEDENIDYFWNQFQFSNNGVFKKGKSSGSFIQLIRMKPFKCLVSGIKHENENACLIIREEGKRKEKKCYFYCYRGCFDKNNRKCIRICKPRKVRKKPDFLQGITIPTNDKFRIRPL